ncbi:MAG: hypothetical protein MI806_31495 [Minwuiales bacterium]|nr:hypothetical protein [Minwuiales bacterium]
MFNLATAVVLALAATKPAYAYLDPGTASVILQVLLGSVAGAMVVGKMYWAKFKDLFRRRPTKPQEIESQTPGKG